MLILKFVVRREGGRGEGREVRGERRKEDERLGAEERGGEALAMPFIPPAFPFFRPPDGCTRERWRIETKMMEKQ